MSVKLATKKAIYNYDSSERLEDAKIIGGNPNGIISYNQCPHSWAYPLYKNMEDRTWFPRQINISKDKVNYSKLPEEIKRGYDLVLSQLITNDSIQTNQLMDSINQYVTSPVVNACLSHQALEEARHSESYAVMAEDICQDTNRIYELYKHDEELFLKNKAVADMYNVLYQGTTPTEKDLLLAFVANQVLEELVFPGGFVFFYSIEQYMPGSSAMIKEINGDETLSHVPLFQNIFNTAIKETFNGIIPEEVIEKAHRMIKHMCEAEIRWTTYVTKGILGFSEHTIKVFIESQANSVCKNLKLPLLYPVVDLKDNPLRKLMLDHLKGGDVESKTMFFEENATEYAKGNLDMNVDLSSVNWDD